MILKKSFLFIIIFFLLKNVVLAQHEFSFYTGGGLSTLNYSTIAGKQKNGLGYNFGIGYGYQPTNLRFGAFTGVGISMHHSSFSLNITDTIRRIAHDDYEDVDFLFSSYLYGHKENQSQMFLTVPLMVKYLFEPYKTLRSQRVIYGAAGVKVGLPLSGRYHVNIDSIRNTGYYHYPEEYEYTDQRFRGFGTFRGMTYNDKLDFNIALSLSLEGGLKFITNKRYMHQKERLTIYTALFFDFGLNNIYKTRTGETQLFIDYNSTYHQQAFSVNGVIDSQYALDKNAEPKPFTEKVRPIAVGIKVTFALEKIQPFAVLD